MICPGPNTQQVLNACELPPHQQRPQSILILVKGLCLSRMELGSFGHPEQGACESQGAVEASTLGPLGTQLSPTAAARGDRSFQQTSSLDPDQPLTPTPTLCFSAQEQAGHFSPSPPFLFPAIYNPGLQQPWLGLDGL